jgi:hypothetical protein
MFQGLRENGTIYILDKTNIVPKLSVGYVEKRSDVYSRYGNPSMPMMTQPTDGVIDFSIRIGENVTELKKIPANMSVCSPEGHPQIMVFDSSEGVLSEIAAIKRQRKDIVDAYEPSVEALSACEQIELTLNPQLAKEQERDKEISQLKQAISNIDDKFETLLRALNNGGATKTKRNNEND